MIKYKAMFGRIQLVEIVSETDKTVVLKNGSKEKKDTSYYSYQDTWAAAHNVLLQHAEHEVEKARSAFEHKNAELERVKSLIPE